MLKLSTKSLIFFTFFFFFTTPVFASTISRPMSNSGLTGYWSFEEGKGNSKTYDRSGYGNTATLVNMDLNSDWVNGATTTGQALNFDGTDNYVNISHSASLTPTGDYTITAWFKTSSTNAEQTIISKFDATGNFPGYICSVGRNDGSTGSTFGQSGATYSIGFWFGDGGGGSSWLVSPTSVNNGQWHFVVCRISGSTASIYTDGVLSASSVRTINRANTGNVNIGTRSDYGTAYFPGSIDEVRVYNRALSVDEISRLYKLQKPKVSGGVSNTGLTGYWPFVEGTGTRVEDMSFNDNNGTVGGSPTWIIWRLGNALSLNGSSNYVNLNKSITAILGGNVNSGTISWWQNPSTAFNSGTPRALWGDTDDPFSKEFSAQVHTDNSWYVGWNQVGLDTRIIVPASATNYVKDQWNFYTFTWVNGGNSILYQNGVQIGINSGNTAVSSNTASLYLGIQGVYGTNPSHQNYFSGSLDEFRIYNRVLSVSEIKNLYEENKQTVINKSNKNRITNGLVGYWTFDGGDIYGTTAMDSSGQGNSGTLTNGPVPVLGRTGQALSFDGTDDNINFGNDSDFGFEYNSSFSGSAWIYVTDTTPTSETIVSKGDNFPEWRGWSFSVFRRATLDSTSLTLFLINADSGAKYIEVNAGASAITANKWYHVAFTYNGNNLASGVRLYIDGVLQSNTVVSDGLSTNTIINTSPAKIGGRTSTDTVQPFKGKIDDVRVYNRTLSDDEIKALYNMGR